MVVKYDLCNLVAKERNMDHSNIVVKTEVQPNGDIFLFYVDENNANESILESSYQNVQILPDSYMVEDFVDEDSPDEFEIAQATEQVAREKWSEDDIGRLINFFIDNKETFLSGTTKKIHLWVVACKTMLTDKKAISCEAKFNSLKKKYIQLCIEKLNGVNITWPFFDLCHQAFHDDPSIKTYLREARQDTVVINKPVQNVVNQDGVFYVKKVNTEQNKDEKVEMMLKLYLKHKKTLTVNSQKAHTFPKGMWESIAMEIGEEDADYWHKRFMNFKQHYIRMVYKRNESGSEAISWPYMGYFDLIYGDDLDFQKKFCTEDNDSKIDVTLMIESSDKLWNDMEKTFLVKYNFDCFNEFQDSTIPKKFLWQEVGRLLDKSPDACKQKYEELKNAHIDKLLADGYNLSDRIPMEILFDNIIAKEAEIEIEKGVETSNIWKVEQIDELVQYVYNNSDMVKDPVCFYVCWAILAKKLQRTIYSCKMQWDELTEIYKSDLDNKKENPDMQITWRYIDLFDRIFDYGMDTNLLYGYKKRDEKTLLTKPLKFGAKRITIKNNEEKLENGEVCEDEPSYDERGFTKRTKKRNGDEKAFRILEFYLKNKEKFTSSHYKKLALWEILAKQIGISATECVHRFRNFKQVYTSYVQQEINKPEKPILWPYYILCKKVFGYRAIKTKLKSGKIDSDDDEDWSAKEIKQVINYFARNYYDFTDDVEDKNKWSQLAQELGRSAVSCCEKFLELRKSYRKLKTMKARNPDVKVSWKYFNMLDDIYKRGAQRTQHVEASDQIMDTGDNGWNDYDGQAMGQDDDDFQCIIVMSEGEDVNNAQIAMQSQDQMPNDVKNINIKTEGEQIVTKWNRRSKTQLLSLYLKYLKTHKDQEICKREMWTEIASKMDEKTPISCWKMFFKLRKLLYETNKTPYHKLLETISAMKPKFKPKNLDLDSIKEFSDVQIDDDKVFKALQYYLQNVEDFVSPKFEKKYLWTELAKYISEPVIKIFSKINYLKLTFNSELDTPFRDILQEISLKESALKDALSDDLPTLETDDVEETWSDIEIERLLTWYLAHLDKFKNPKFVRSYLWMEASDILKKSPLVCSKKMLEIRSQYRTMVKDSPEVLDNWKFYNLCQRIYGTGKKSTNN